MRRVVSSVAAALLLSIVVAGTAFGAHCRNESKNAGAGQHATLTINLTTGEETFNGVNAAGRLKGGFLDLWLDTNGDGTADVLACDDTFIVSNHSGRAAPGQTEAEGAPGVLPPIIRGSDPGGADAGLGSC